MKIVYCHNYYRLRGGEDISFESDLQLLRERGHTVIPFIRENAHINDSKPLSMAANTVWNRSTHKEMLDLLRAESPDVLHCNNLFPQISVSVYSAARKLKVPVVQALRNYRSFCANSFFFRDGHICTSCLGSTASWQGIRYACYRDSRLATSVVVATQLFHRLVKVRTKLVDAFFTPTQFAREVHIRGGFPSESLFVRSNFVATDVGMNPQRGKNAVFIGRLSGEKGLATVLEAWQKNRIDIPLIIIGDGPDRAALEAKAAGNPKIVFTGQLSTPSVTQQLTNARVLIMPSIWYETFGRTMAEAFAQGIPVIASRLGTMIELVDNGRNGFLFEPGNANELADAMQSFLALDEQQSMQMRLEARETYCQRFSPEVSYQMLLKVYEYALRNKPQYESVAQAIAASIETSTKTTRLVPETNTNRAF